MTIFQALVLGIVQGITEFLPISSSGFLILVPNFFGWAEQDLAFDAILHLATLVAVVAALGSELRLIFRSFFFSCEVENQKWKKLAVWIIVSSIPALIVGFIFKNFVGEQLRSVEVVAWSFIIWGAVLYIADRISSKLQNDVTCVGLKRSVIIGFAQALALIPGTSRSGITITAGLFLGLTRETAARLSFLFSIPIIAAAGIYETGNLFIGNVAIPIWPIVIGFTAAAVSAFLTIKALLIILRRYNYTQIAIFRVLVGVLILLIG